LVDVRAEGPEPAVVVVVRLVAGDPGEAESPAKPANSGGMAPASRGLHRLLQLGVGRPTPMASPSRFAFLAKHGDH
jgi:hypothetical protein